MLDPFTMPTTKMSSGPCSSFCRPLGIKPGHAGLTHALQQCQAKSHRQSHRQFQAAAASDIVAMLQPSLDVIPYTSSSAPKLKSRSMVGSPLDGLWHAVSSAALQAELLSAAYIDKHNPMGPAVISVLAGSAAAMGLDAFTLLSSYGLPPNIQDMLLAAFGAWDTTVYWVAALLLSVPLTAWAVRAWWATNMQLLSSPVAQLLQQITQQRNR
eukprot:GHRR01008333.1.p1 GENE.GHRR01008333.1~~GHRR01008333.1.p1  ORF type:complete len:212 (+),score=81.80 GHRR01008333.1:308-943(+)